MNTQSNAMPESAVPRDFALVTISPFQMTYWSILRELWENRSIYVGPLVAGGVFLLGFLINMIALRHGSHGAWPLDPAANADWPSPRPPFPKEVRIDIPGRPARFQSNHAARPWRKPHGGMEHGTSRYTPGYRLMGCSELNERND